MDKHQLVQELFETFLSGTRQPRELRVATNSFSSAPMAKYRSIVSFRQMYYEAAVEEILGHRNFRITADAAGQTFCFIEER